MTEIIEQWYNQLIEDLADIITETGFTSRWALVEGYHNLGSRILQENNNFERSKIYGENIVQCIAESLRKKPRTIYYAVQFAKIYPNLNLLPEGKDCSWFKIINKYLTTGEKKHTITKGELMKQIEEIKEFLQHEWELANQDINDKTLGSIDCGKSKYIRYLQDQVNKITKELEV